MIRYFEELSMNAWPALQTMLYDGWVLRFAKGYTKRSNSISPLYTSCDDTEQKVKNCEKLYNSLGFNTVYKMTSHALPSDLDRLLENRGYSAEAHTSVQTADLTVLPAVDPACIASPQLTDEWFHSFCSFSRVSGENQNTLKSMLQSIVPDKRFILLKSKGRPVACGMYVLEDGYAGVYEVVVDPAQRGQGFGRALMLNLLNHAKGMGVHKSYLQVVLDNTPALHLYRSLGYTEVYQYWYRVKSVERPAFDI